MLEAIKNVLLSFSPSRSLYESMMKYDFKIKEPRTDLMQLCFSHLAAGPLFLGVILIYLNPFKYVLTIQKIFGAENRFTFFLLDGHLSSMLLCFGVFFIAEWIFRKEHLLTLIVFFLLVQADLHIHLATSSILGIYFSRYCHQWWFHIDLESETKKIWQMTTNLQLFSWIIVSVFALVALNYLQLNHFFTSSMTENRFQFLAIVIFCFHALAFTFCAIWGHFYVRRHIEPSYLPVYYSTAHWILRFNMSNRFQNVLKEQAATTLVKHRAALANFQSFKDQSPGLGLSPILTTLNKEISYLEQASSRLTIE